MAETSWATSTSSFHDAPAADPSVIPGTPTSSAPSTPQPSPGAPPLPRILTMEQAEQHMMEALGSPSRPTDPSAPPYTSTEDIVQQINRATAAAPAKGSMMMNMLENMQKIKGTRQSAPGSSAGTGTADRAADGSGAVLKKMGQMGRRTLDSIHIDEQKAKLVNLAKTATTTINLDRRKEQIKNLANAVDRDRLGTFAQRMKDRAKGGLMKRSPPGMTAAEEEELLEELASRGEGGEGGDLRVGVAEGQEPRESGQEGALRVLEDYFDYGVTVSASGVGVMEAAGPSTSHAAASPTTLSPPLQSDSPKFGVHSPPFPISPQAPIAPSIPDSASAHTSTHPQPTHQTTTLFPSFPPQQHPTSTQSTPTLQRSSSSAPSFPSLVATSSGNIHNNLRQSTEAPSTPASSTTCHSASSSPLAPPSHPSPPQQQLRTSEAQPSLPANPVLYSITSEPSAPTTPASFPPTPQQPAYPTPAPGTTTLTPPPPPHPATPKVHAASPPPPLFRPRAASHPSSKPSTSPLSSSTPCPQSLPAPPPAHLPPRHQHTSSASSSSGAPPSSSMFSFSLFNRSTEDTASVRSDHASQADINELDVMMTEGVDRQQAARTGIRVTVLGEHVEVYAEKGTKMPNILVKEITLELECLLSASFEYSPLLGWQAPDKVTFEVQRLERTVQGSNIPLPRTLIKTVLNWILPKVLTETFLTTLPVELGAYTLASQEHFHLSGELRVIGPGLATFTTDLTIPSELPDPATTAAAKGKYARQATTAATAAAAAAAAVAAQRARQLLNLTESQGSALAELFTGRNSMLETPRPLTISELCRFYTTFSSKSSWQPLCNMWNRALQVVFEHHGVSDRFSFQSFMEESVAALVKKPVRVEMALDRLDVHIDVDGALKALRDLMERTAREMQTQKNTHGAKSTAEFFKKPLEVQLEALNHWHDLCKQQLHTFKAKFKSAGASLMASVDNEQFELGLQEVHYEGPCDLQVPIPAADLDGTGGFTFEMKLPDPEKAMTSIVGRVSKIAKKLAAASVAQSCATADSTSLQVVGRGVQAADMISRFPTDMRGTIATLREASPDPGSPLSRHLDEMFDSPVLAGSSLGSVSVHRLAVSLKLDQERVAQLLKRGLQANADAKDLAMLLAGSGDLFTGNLAVGPRPRGSSSREAPEEGGADGEEVLWANVSTNDITQARADAERVVLHSQVSPVVAIKLLHAALVGIAYQFKTSDKTQRTKKLATLDALFSRLKELLGKDTLDALLSLKALAEVVEDRLRLRVCGEGGEEPGRLVEVDGFVHVPRPYVTEKKAGGVGGMGLAAAAVAAAGSTYYPVYVVNDINLLTILASAKSLMDS